jgi:hypothetical protein
LVRKDVSGQFCGWRSESELKIATLGMEAEKKQKPPLTARKAGYFQYSQKCNGRLGCNLSFGSTLAEGGKTPGVS